MIYIKFSSQSRLLICFLGCIVIFAGCDDYCWEDDSRNERKFIKLESPTQDWHHLHDCPEPEDIAALAYGYPGPLDDLISCQLRNTETSINPDKWGMLLQVDGVCANRERYEEDFRFVETQFNCNSDTRQMGVQAVQHGDAYAFQMCPDPHVPNNHGAAIYEFRLYTRSEGYAATEECNCQNDALGVFANMYFLRGFSRIRIEDLDLNYYFNSSCIRDPLVFYDPIVYSMDCL